MNRRSFLFAVPFLPSVLQAIARAPVRVGPEFFYQRTNGIAGLLNECGKVVEPAGPDLDSIFARLYAVKRNRHAAEPLVWVRS